MAVSNSLFLQLAMFRNIVKSSNIRSNLFRRITNRLDNVSLYSIATNPAEKSASEKPIEKTPRKMSKAMLAYLERARAHDEFIKNEREKYQIGKRHLANMMGEDPDLFTQNDIERSIEYLFPSGLYDKAARPVMKPPEEMFPPRKAAEFDELGKPFHTMFYTAQPNYYKSLYDIVEEMQKLNEIEDSMTRKGVAPDKNISIDLSGSDWLDKKELEKLFLENMSDDNYEYIQATLDRLINHPYSHMVQNFVMKFRKKIKSHAESLIVPQLEIDENGRPYITVPDCMRKSARGSVTLRGKGTGKIIVNGIPVENYFTRHQDLEQIVFPLTFTGLLDSIDVEAQVRDGGPTGQSGCIRWGISWGLRSFVDLDMIEKMRLAGLLTRDWRRRERKKWGQEGARRKFTWKKR
ncbi:small ribosomal subunit protein uS9m-like isoform X2 [Phymastichus coffea]|uniref:small ribosomal subunit protein uS9m-like isoform X2 n=1 Tax=Phymastichus coffea TaxID=108790 RepID=UPI00273CDAC4|nr:small ribosomal subunit protein uS9m-like isoform X2 [Phymastichus coffea]